jgi:hypothetical protein
MRLLQHEQFLKWSERVHKRFEEVLHDGLKRQNIAMMVLGTNMCHATNIQLCLLTKRKAKPTRQFSSAGELALKT